MGHIGNPRNTGEEIRMSWICLKLFGLSPFCMCLQNVVCNRTMLTNSFPVLFTHGSLLILGHYWTVRGLPAITHILLFNLMNKMLVCLNILLEIGLACFCFEKKKIKLCFTPET